MLLGLGDVVLPGLLLAFAARVDALSPGRRPSHWLALVAAYALGLALANAAVAASGVGQPALLYLVPCTLGALSAKAKLDGSLAALWRGPAGLADDGPPAGNGDGGPGGDGRGGVRGAEARGSYGAVAREDEL